MYRVSFRERLTDEVVMSFRCYSAPAREDMQEIDFPMHDCYMDVCRICANPPIADNTNFRQEVEADLEPFDPEEL